MEHILPEDRNDKPRERGITIGIMGCAGMAFRSAVASLASKFGEHTEIIVVELDKPEIDLQSIERQYPVDINDIILKSREARIDVCEIKASRYIPEKKQDHSWRNGHHQKHMNSRHRRK